MNPRPKLIVFDLDFTIWPFWVDTHVLPPFKVDALGKVYDSQNSHIILYPDTLPILNHLKAENYSMAVASRTSAIREAESLLDLFDLNHFFSMKAIYPGSKISHFQKFHRISKIPYEDMLFFDDEERNIIELNRIGVTCQFITHGMRWKDLHEGLDNFKKSKANK